MSLIITTWKLCLTELRDCCSQCPVQDQTNPRDRDRVCSVRTDDNKDRKKCRCLACLDPHQSPPITLIKVSNDHLRCHLTDFNWNVTIQIQTAAWNIKTFFSYKSLINTTLCCAAWLVNLYYKLVMIAINEKCTRKNCIIYWSLSVDEIKFNSSTSYTFTTIIYVMFHAWKIKEPQ